MRLIDADELMKNINETCKGFHPQGYYTCRKDVIDIIEQTDTAYDLDKVIEQLTEDTSCPNCSINCSDTDICGHSEAIAQAIEIVQNGGKND